MERDERLLPLPKTSKIEITATQEETPVNYSPVYDEENFDQKRSVREYFNVVYKRLPIIVALAILSTVVTALYMYRQPSQYQASTQLIIEPPKPKQLQKGGFNINFGNDPHYMDTQIQLLYNPELMGKVVMRLELYKNPNLLESENKGIGFMFRSLFSSEKPVSKESSLPILAQSSDQSDEKQEVVLSPEEKARVNYYRAVLSSGLTIQPVNKTSLVYVTVASTNPELSAKVADTVATIYREEDIKRAIEGEEKAYKDITKSIEELTATIERKEMERINALRQNSLPVTKGQDLTASRLQQLSDQLLTASNDRARAQATYNAAVEAKGSDNILAIVGEKNRAIVEARLQNQKRKDELKKRIEDIDKDIQNAETLRKELEVKYQPDFPEVKKVAARIENLQKTKTTIEAEVSKEIDTESAQLKQNAEKEVLASLNADLQTTQSKENKLKIDYQNELNSANAQGLAITTLTTLTREIDTGRSLLDRLIQDQKQQELAIASSMPENIKIITHAVAPVTPFGPPRNRNIFIALMMSLAAGIGLAFLLDYLDDSIKSSDDVGRHLGLPTLALIPHQIAPAKSKLGLLPVKANGNGNGNGGGSSALVALEDTRSAMAEAYRHLRTSLLFSSAGKPPQTILVTSSQPAEGKTTTAINTAITLAQSGADVVIIDCDLRRPRLHTHFGMGNANGLTNYLSGEKSTENLLKPFADLPKLKVITSGPIPPNPAELLSSHEMKNLLQFLKTNYKHVVIDSPPAISFTDAAILSTQVDGVVLVAMAGKSSIHLIRRFKQRLSSIGARIYGVVLNGIKSNSVEYGYYGYGYTSYYAAPDDDDSTPIMEEEKAYSAIHTTKG